MRRSIPHSTSTTRFSPAGAARRLARVLLAASVIAVPATLALGPVAGPAGAAAAAHRARSGRTAVFPAVARATDRKVEPKTGPGELPAPTRLSTRNLVVGRGTLARPGDTVEVNYVGTSYRTGKAFDSSWSRGQPTTFSLLQVVPGFAAGIEGMRVGGRREIVIPPALGYGASGYPPAVAPHEVLVFVVDLLKVTPAAA